MEEAGQFANDIKELLAAHNGRIDITELHRAFRERFSRALPSPASLGCRSIQHCIETRAKEVARVVPHGSHQVLVAVYPVKVVERFLKDLRRSHCQQGKHVSVAALTAGLCQQLGVARFEDLGVGKPSQVTSLRALTELERRVAAHISAYPATRCAAAGQAGGGQASSWGGQWTYGGKR